MFVSGRNYRGSENIERKKIVRRFTSLDRHYSVVRDCVCVKCSLESYQNYSVFFVDSEVNQV